MEEIQRTHSWNRHFPQKDTRYSTQTPQLTAVPNKFLPLASDDLDRIKSTSFFQRVPPPSEAAQKARETEEAASEVNEENQEAEEPAQPEHTGIVEVSESESEEEDEEDIFDTSYIDAIAAGEVKLAYIPGKINSPWSCKPTEGTFSF